MPDIIIRTDEALNASFQGPPDIVWNFDIDDDGFGTGDLALADPELEPENIGGLSALDPLGTAIYMLLGTDRRAPDYLNVENGPAGWFGDSFDLNREAGECELGSLLWTLNRATLSWHDLDNAKWMAAEALQTLIEQGRVAEFQIEAIADYTKMTLSLQIGAFDSRGQSIFQGAYALLT